MRPSLSSLHLRLVTSLLIAIVISVMSPDAAVARAQSESIRTETKPRAGDKAPSFVLPTVDSVEPRSLDDVVRGQKLGAVLVFVSCRCPYVAQARQPLRDLFKQYGARVAFVGVNANQNEAAEDVKADALRNFPFPVLRDQGAKVADLYAADRTPEAFLIDAAGHIRYHGGISDLSSALADFTAGRPVAKTEAKAFGCTIKRRP